ncbi:hypothetical protein VVMO6_03175 [Vibrio vulnificus MO6-24/O]|nr:hypothetical protein VVMO6_03175 [Vibrio vulnificus MO6-24/O]
MFHLCDALWEEYVSLAKMSSFYREFGALALSLMQRVLIVLA